MRGNRFWVVAAVGLALVLVAGSALWSGGPSAAVVPAPGDVVARLRSGGAGYPDDLRAALAAQRAAPGDAAMAMAAARALIDTGRARGDSRLVGAAIGVLRPHLDPGDAQVLALAATARQYQHDFPGALALLDRAAALAPRDVNILLSRATIRTVQGDYAAARADCARIAALPQPAVAFLCQATTHVMTTEGPAFRQRLQGIVAQPGLLDPALHPWALGLIGEIAAHQGDTVAAEAAFAAVLAASPGAQREALLLADLRLTRGDGAGAFAVLRGQPDTDGVQLRRLLALRVLGQDDASLAAALDTRFALNIDLGLTAHAREEAMFYLDAGGRPALALARAQVNWAMQHEIEDAVLLTRAAAAAGQPDTARIVQDWMAREGVTPRKDFGPPGETLPIPAP